MSLETRPVQVSELAVKWALRLQGADLTEPERAALHRWLLADPAHADELSEACCIMTAVSELSDEQRADALALPEDESSEEQLEATPTETSLQPRWRAYALAASVLFATVLGVFWSTAASHGWLPQTYRTSTSETRLVDLPDGSVVHLNAKTTLRWSGFTRDRRTELVAGQALFDVVHDPAQPFLVRVDDGLVRVLGTKFDLNRRSDATILTVLEGAVEVVNATRRVDGAWHRIVYANQRLAYGPGGLTDDVRAVDALRTLSWREFSLDLDKEPLSAVIEELSRYTDQPILVSDGQLKTHRVSGALKVRDIREALRDLEVIAPVVVRQDGTAFIVNHRASNPLLEQ